MKKLFLFLFVFFVAVSFCAAEKVVIKVATMAPDRSPWDIALRGLAQDWYKLTNGEVSMRFINVTTLGGEGGAVKKFRTIRPGQPAPLQGGIFSPVGLSMTAPDSSLFTLLVPFAIRSQDELDAVTMEFGQYFIDKFRDNGFELLTWSNIGWLSFYSKKQFKTLDDLKSLRMASGGIASPELDRAFQLSGFTTESVPIEKISQSLQSKSGVEAFYSVPMYAYAMGYAKHISYFLDTKVCPVMAGFVVSAEAWSKIPAKYKPEMLRLLDEMVSNLNDELEENHRSYTEKLIAEGVEPLTLSLSEAAIWEEDFNREVEKITRDMPHLFNPDLLQKIQKFLADYRARR